MKKRVEPFRVAVRDQGEHVVAYFAPPQGQEGWVEVGRLRKTLADDCPRAYSLWIDMWRTAAEEMIAAVLPGAEVATEIREPLEKKA